MLVTCRDLYFKLDIEWELTHQIRTEKPHIQATFNHENSSSFRKKMDFFQKGRSSVFVVSLAAVFWAVTQRSTQKKRLLTCELHSFLIVLAVCLRSFEQTNHVKIGLTDLRDSRCESVVLIKAFFILRLQACL